MLRFEATIHPGEREVSLERIADLDLDRVPDPEGGIRVLITAEDAERVLAEGYEVRLVRALPVRPLDSSLVMDDESAAAWLNEETKGLDREGDA